MQDTIYHGLRNFKTIEYIFVFNLSSTERLSIINISKKKKHENVILSIVTIWLLTT